MTYLGIALFLLAVVCAVWSWRVARELSRARRRRIEAKRFDERLRQWTEEREETGR